MAVPIVLKTKDEEVQLADNTRTCFVVAKGGVYRRRETEYFTSCVPATAVPQALKEQKTYLYIKDGFPKMPVEDLQKVAGFFLAVFNQYKSEAIVILVQNKETKQMEIICPKQYVTVWKTGNKYTSGSLHVKYDMPQIDPDKYIYLGDIHSHCDLQAYASSTDTHDEEYRDGVHMVLGYIDRATPDFHCEYSVDGMRFTVRFSLVVEGEYAKTDPNFPKDWMKMVNVQESSSSVSYGGRTEHGSGKGWLQSNYGQEQPFQSSSKKRKKKQRSPLFQDVPQDVLELFGDDQDDAEGDKTKWHQGK